MDRPGTCIILDKKCNIANSSCHFGSYGSIWTGPSPKKYYILPYDPQCHELFVMYCPNIDNWRMISPGTNSLPYEVPTQCTTCIRNNLYSIPSKSSDCIFKKNILTDFLILIPRLVMK
jgi:hypothetical protein